MSNLPQDGRAPYRNQRWLECTGATEAYAVMHVSDASRSGTRTILELETPTEDGQIDGIVVTGVNAKICTADFPAYAQYDSADGTPAAGETWGPMSGSLKLHKGQAGFVILGDYDGTKVRVMRAAAPTTLVELCLATAHPGRGTPFECYLGTWSPAINGWSYGSCASTVWAIDWREGTPYPEAGSRGLFTPRASDYYGTIYECVSLDCSSPGECCP